jgi:peptidyl-prolyl cis-trans isomerase D
VRAGEDFAKIARESSDDPGSRAEGGELGWAGREAYVAPFADALFALQPGQISDPVQTQFGYHIIQLEEVRPTAQRSFDEVRDEIDADYRREAAQTRFYELSQQLADESFAALTELESVAGKLDLPLQTLKDFTREGAGPFAGEKDVIDAVFSPDVLEQRQNSQPVQIGETAVVVLRVTDHRPPVQRPLDEVRAQIEETLRSDSARDAALGAAQAAASRVKDGSKLEAALPATADAEVQRATVQRTDSTLPPELVSAVFAAPRPAAAGSPSTGTATLASGDVAVFAVHAVRPGSLASLADPGQKLQQGAQLAGASEFAGYLGELERNAKIKRSENVFE